MVGRRTAALGELAASLLGLALAGRHRERTSDESAPPSSFWLAVGAASSVIYHWLYDRDVGGIRRRRLRSAAATAAWTAASGALAVRSESDSRDFADGSLVGTLAYRCWYGLLRPVPGPDADGE